jgi:ketol-acid reductoisomerase
VSKTAPAFRAFGESDGELRQLAGRTIAFIGYGNQGRAQALNLRDSLRAASLAGDVTIVASALRDETWSQAEADGFPLRTVPEAAQAADVLFLLVPDEALPDIFAAQIAPHLNPNDALVFATGYNLAFGTLPVPSNVDVVMVAPRMIGRQMRLRFERGDGFYSYLAVEQDASGNAWPLLLALAKGIGTLSAGGGAFELAARDEAVLDLFHEQGFGALFGAMMFEMLRVGQEAGLPPEALVLDYYLSGELAESMQAMAELGFVEQSYLHSRTSQYGGMTRSLRVDREAIRKHLEEVMREITSGDFAREWAAEQSGGAENFEKLRALGRQHNPFTPIELRLRELLREVHDRSEM